MNDPIVSICIPTYEMAGQGVAYLEHSFSILTRQTFKSFEVIVSDQSIDDGINRLCERWNDRLLIRYVKAMNRGNSSHNTNNAIHHACGKVIKPLFQDDFLTSDRSLEAMMFCFAGSQNYWLATASCQSPDGVRLERPNFPFYHDEIQYGTNTISSPSVIMFKNENVLRFDENLIWLMDVDYYKQLYDKHGLPAICNQITVANREHSNQISSSLVSDAKKQSELEYVRRKYVRT